MSNHNMCYSQKQEKSAVISDFILTLVMLNKLGTHTHF